MSNDKCPYCDASGRNGLFQCGTITHKKAQDNRDMYCYEREIAQLKAKLAHAQKWQESADKTLAMVEGDDDE